jgi:hypothetical protein
MKEGIIQKVLDKYIENSYYPVEEMFENLKQDLIAEIKTIENKLTNKHDRELLDTLLEYIIGDLHSPTWFWLSKHNSSQEQDNIGDTE